MTVLRTRYTLCAAAVLCLAVLSSSLFIIVEADHDCTDTDCAVCALLSTCGDMLKFLGTASLFALYLAATTYALRSAPARHRAAAPTTLITMKVKLSD